jgi:hypothetical protein
MFISYHRIRLYVAQVRRLMFTHESPDYRQEESSRQGELLLPQNISFNSNISDKSLYCLVYVFKENNLQTQVARFTHHSLNNTPQVYATAIISRQKRRYFSE